MFHCYFLFCQFLLVAWLTAGIYEYLCYISLFYIEVGRIIFYGIMTLDSDHEIGWIDGFCQWVGKPSWY